MLKQILIALFILQCFSGTFGTPEENKKKKEQEDARKQRIIASKKTAEQNGIQGARKWASSSAGRRFNSPPQSKTPESPQDFLRKNGGTRASEGAKKALIPKCKGIPTDTCNIKNFSADTPRFDRERKGPRKFGKECSEFFTIDPETHLSGDGKIEMWQAYQCGVSNGRGKYEQGVCMFENGVGQKCRPSRKQFEALYYKTVDYNEKVCNTPNSKLKKSQGYKKDSRDWKLTENWDSGHRYRTQWSWKQLGTPYWTISDGAGNPIDYTSQGGPIPTSEYPYIVAKQCEPPEVTGEKNTVGKLYKEFSVLPTTMTNIEKTVPELLAANSEDNDSGSSEDIEDEGSEQVDASTKTDPQDDASTQTDQQTDASTQTDQQTDASTQTDDQAHRESLKVAQSLTSYGFSNGAKIGAVFGVATTLFVVFKLITRKKELDVYHHIEEI